MGETIDKQTVKKLKTRGIDPCGENGESHTLVTDCPEFDKNIHVENVKKVSREPGGEKYSYQDVRISPKN